MVVGRYDWQRELIESAESMAIGELTVRVVRPAGLVLLKLYAGGPKDSWEIESLLESHENAEAIKAEVNETVGRLPAECGDLWRRFGD